MNYQEFTNLVFKELPEFKDFYEEDLDENYYNFFMGALGLFIRDSLVDKESYGTRYLKTIDNLYNENYLNKEFINMLNINVLEILTDERESQKKSLEILTKHCLIEFKFLLRNSFYTL